MEELFCRCKINLLLRVTGRRADGYHTLETLFWPLESPSDRLSADLGATPGIVIDCGAPALPTDRRNLVCRAAELYAAAAGISPAWRFRLEKHVPVAAGLGGGSADAAAALQLLESRYGALGRDKLRELAVRIGADVPFFLDPRPAAARGIGDELEFLTGRLPHLPLVLVDPGFPVRTGWAFGKLDEAGQGGTSAALPELAAALESGDLERIARNLGNDFAGVLMRKFPLLSLIRAELMAAGALAVELTGSGPALFALFPDDAAARRAAAELAGKQPRWTTIAAEDGM